ncbi:MAG: phosphate/phosphite/phosphonate ABC transporter substrate-binding protein, partial [Chloroflexi bacterium]|nr:phosphate/phosphite/phosphonate ABC transporter substrate-binding protein [Chloroflexota bacterium]
LVLTLGACGGTQAASPSVGATGSAPASASTAPMLSAAPLAANLPAGQYYHPAVLNLATIGNNEQGTEERMAPVVDYLSKTIGLKINYVQTTSYSSVIEAMRAGKVDLASYGPLSYVIAKDQANAISLVAIPQQTDGTLGYHSEIITNVNSGITDVKQLQGKTFAFADPASTSGYLFPQLMLYDDGVTDYKSFFKTTSFSGGHQQSLVAIANNKVDAAGVCDTCIAGFIQAGIAKQSDIRVLQTSPLIPPSPWAIRADIDPALHQAILNAFLNEPPEVIEAAELLKTPPKYPYQAIPDSAYDPVRQLSTKLHIDLSQING